MTVPLPMPSLPTNSDTRPIGMRPAHAHGTGIARDGSGFRSALISPPPARRCSCKSCTRARDGTRAGVRRIADSTEAHHQRELEPVPHPRLAGIPQERQATHAAYVKPPTTTEFEFWVTRRG